MSTIVLEAADALSVALANFDPCLLLGGDAARVAEKLTATAKACTAAATLAAARAVDCGAHKGTGAKDGPSWLARHSGVTPGQARQALDTVRSLHDLPATQAALVAGDISLAQAAEISQAEADTPGAEQTLLETARSSDLARTKEHAREHRQAHVDPADLRTRQFAAREFRHWVDRDGMIQGRFALPPELGVPFIRRVETAALRARRAARAAGRSTERFDAYRADGLAAVATASQAGESQRRADLVIVCDLAAWRRGFTHRGEPCHIIGGGPTTVEVAKQLGRDAFLKALLYEGTKIDSVKHFGRHIPAEIRTALDVGSPPTFTGAVCDDCGSRHPHLEYDHVDPVANGGPTTYTNLKARCWTCHEHKTEQDRQAGLLGPDPDAWKTTRPPP